MEFLIGLACLAATVYFFYLMADLLDIRAERKRMERERRRRRWLFTNTLMPLQILD